MAKDADDRQDSDEKMVPMKPKKKPSGGGGGEINMFMLIGAIAGTVILMVVILGAAFYFFIMPELKGGAHGNDSASAAHEKIKERSEQKEKSRSQIEEWEEEDLLLGDKGVHIIETGKIITNPRNSTKFAVMNLALEFRVSEKDERFPEGEIPEEDPIKTKLMAGVKNRLYSIIGSLTVEDFYAMGSDSLRMKFKNDLKPIFFKNKLFLKDVLLTEYLIQ